MVAGAGDLSLHSHFKPRVERTECACKDRLFESGTARRCEISDRTEWHTSFAHQRNRELRIFVLLDRVMVSTFQELICQTGLLFVGSKGDSAPPIQVKSRCSRTRSLPTSMLMVAS